MLIALKDANIFQWCFGWALTKLVSLSEAGEGRVKTSALLFVGTKLLQQLAHLLLAHVQQTLQGHLTWAHLLKTYIQSVFRSHVKWNTWMTVKKQ